MKTNYWWMLAVSLSLAAPAGRADDQPPAPTPTPGKDATKPAAPRSKPPVTSGKKSSSGTSATATLSPNPISGPGPAIVTQKSVNVRGRPAINGEVVSHLSRGDRVNVLEEVTLKSPKQDEPSKWAKISLPTNATVWANASFIDPTNNTVIAKRLNLRSGPSEAYSVVGRIEKGAAVKPIDQKGEWVRLEPPAAAYGFVAAHLLSKDTGMMVAAATLPKEGTAPPPIETAVPANPTPATAAEPTVAPPSATTPPPIDTATPTAPPPEETLVKRIVTREGIVQRSVSIQAPTHFILQSLDTKKAINYLFTTNVALKDYFGQRILVTGEEMLDERWPNTPVIEVDKIETVP